MDTGPCLDHFYTFICLANILRFSIAMLTYRSVTCPFFQRNDCRKVTSSWCKLGQLGRGVRRHINFWPKPLMFAGSGPKKNWGQETATLRFFGALPDFFLYLFVRKLQAELRSVMIAVVAMRQWPSCQDGRVRSTSRLRPKGGQGWLIFEIGSYIDTQRAHLPPKFNRYIMVYITYSNM